MYIQKLPNAASSKIAITGTATTLLSLMTTSAGEALGVAERKLNACDIAIEGGGDARVLFDGNTPTATNGFLLARGMVYHFRGVPIHSMRLIRVGTSNVTASVQIGQSETGENTSSSAISPASETAAVKFDSAEGKEFTIAGAQTDYNVATQQSLFAIPRTKVEILSNVAATIEVNTGTSAPFTIALKANEEKVIEDFTVTNLFITATDATVRVIAYA